MPEIVCKCKRQNIYIYIYIYINFNLKRKGKSNKSSLKKIKFTLIKLKSHKLKTSKVSNQIL